MENIPCVDDFPIKLAASLASNRASWETKVEPTRQETIVPDHQHEAEEGDNEDDPNTQVVEDSSNRVQVGTGRSWRRQVQCHSKQHQKQAGWNCIHKVH